VLGCTHYPLIRSNIERLYPTLKIIDPSQIVILSIARELKERNIMASQPVHKNTFYASDLSENFINMIDKIFETSEVKVKFKSFDLEDVRMEAK